jgi:hypothetical protein
VKLILLTSARPEPDLQNVEGTSFRDTFVPFNALMKVREHLGEQAVARACDYFKKEDWVDENCEKKAGAVWKLQLVELEDQAYALPLAWNLSPTTLSLVSSLLGRSELCGRNRHSDKSDEISRIMGKNSCVLKDIEQALASSR